jgi:hypothetical protein
MSIIDFD